MSEATGIAVDWHSVGHACGRLGLAFGAAFLVLAVLEAVPGYSALAEESPWVPKYIGDGIAFGVAIALLWRACRGNLEACGLAVKWPGHILVGAVAVGALPAALGLLFDYLALLATGDPIGATYPVNVANVLGMLSFQWIFVGILEEPVIRGLVQAPLMKELAGSIRVLKWRLHVGTVVTALIFGLGHSVPPLFFGGSLIASALNALFATLYGLCSGYSYERTRSLAPPVVMHNVVDGLLATARLICR
jgi:membrane protease YdiL (CAAX protease family)